MTATWVPSRFTDLNDTPAAYRGQARKFPRANSGETALEFVDPFRSTVDPVADYGADPTGVADSTTAFLNAIASGSHIIIPPGDYLVSDTLTFSTAGQQMYPLLWGSTFGEKPVTFWFQSTTKDFIKVQASHVSLAGFATERPTGYTTPTAGADITIAGSPLVHATTITRPSLSNIRMVNPYIGLKIESYHWTLIVDNLDINTPKQYGVYHTASVPYGGNVYRNIRVAGNGTAPAGIYIDQSDYNQWDVITVGGSAGFTTAHIYLNSATEHLYNQQMTNIYCDNIPSGSWAVKLVKGAYRNTSHRFAVLQANTSNAGGGYVGAGVDQTSFNGAKLLHLSNNSSAGFDIYGTDTTLNDVKIGFADASIATKDGVIIRDGSSGTIVSASRVKKCNYGINVEEGATYATITGNDFTGNTNAAAIGLGVRATCKISNNQGINDYITSISATPEYIGQEALVSGVWYRAIGTSSTADWKALN